MSINLNNKVWQDPTYFLAFGFGTGLMPVAQGTFGTVAAILVYLMVCTFAWPIYLFFVLIAFLFGIFICSKVETDIGISDYSGIVWDEVVGFLATMALAPPTLTWIIIGFILFRIFDIWKPPPISYVDKNVKGGLGIMLDDLLAALPAFLIMQLLILITNFIAH